MFGSILSAAGNLLGGFLGKKNADKQMDMQREFAQNGIQWRVKDAEAAGIHPLAALGAQTTSYSPVSVGDVSTGIANASQDIGRAIDSTRTQDQRVSAVAKTMQDLQLKRMGLENELLSAQIARVRQPANPPAMPSPGTRYLIDGQGDTASSRVQDQPMQRVASDPSHTWSEPGAVTDTGYARTPTGLAPVYSKDVKERYEDDFLGSLTWNVRNRLLPTLGVSSNPPPKSALPDWATHWEYSVVRQEYVPKRNATHGDYYRTGGGF